MFQLLFGLIFAEMALIVIFVFKTPLRKLVILGLDRIKRGSGPLVVKAVGGTVSVVMLSSAYNASAIYSRWSQDGEISPTDQILFTQHLLEASLLGFSIFLALMVDRLHHYMRELRVRRKSMEVAKKQKPAFEDGKAGMSEEIKALEEELTEWKSKIEKMESELEGKSKAVTSAEASAVALKKQSEGFLLEYDRLLEENQNLKSQLQAMDRRLSHSDSKKSL